MLPISLLGPILALNLWPWHAAQTVTHTYAEPSWKMAITRDRFTGEVRCRVYQGPARRPWVVYARQSLAFRFVPRLSTLQAAYRVDGGTARPWTGVYPTLVQQGAGPSGASLENPTGGLVILPLSAFAGGHTVVIRPTPRARPRAFLVDGLTDVLANARQQGCASDTAFLR